MTMKNVWTIARRDFRSYFTSPIAYIVITAFMVLMGWMFFNTLSWFNLQNMQYRQYHMGKGASITDGILRPLFGNMNVIFLFVLPFVTMRLFAEERKTHTIELLMTSPVRLAEIIAGKFLSSFILVAVMLALTLTYPVILLATGTPDTGPIITSYVGTLLLAACYLSVGVFCSALTENQIVAAVLTFATLLFFWLISWASQSAGPVWNDILTNLSLITHFNNFSQGLIETTDVVYYLSFAGVFLFLTHRVLDSYRWR
jgi:ABC-2 type transport system permease protein